MQGWLDRGQPYLAPSGARGRTPFDVALDTGFHSLVEVFLRAGVPQEDRDAALCTAVCARRLELAQLLVEYGANPHSIAAEDVFDSRSPELIRWMITVGIDLESRWPIARMFENRQRECLGIYMDLRDRVPSAPRQAAMALRVHAREGNLKWVSLLLWAGADPRLRVAIRDDREPGTEMEEDEGTALEDAVIHGQAEVLLKFRVDSTRDDINALLCQCWLAPHPQIARVLLELGANVNARTDGRTPIDAAMGALSFSLDSLFGYSSFCENKRINALACIDVLAKAGARWNPNDARGFSSFRRALGRADSSTAIRVLKRLVDARAVEEGAFHDLMRTPKMKALLESGWVGDTAALKRYAGFAEKGVKRVRRASKRRVTHQ